jgi:hypothetical protein
MRPAAMGNRPGRLWRLATRAAVLPIMLCCSCYSPAGAYRGTGALNVSGEASSQLASHTIEFVYCADDTDEAPRPSFFILAIGEQCVIDGIGSPYWFQADGGSVCTLAFQEGTHTLRLTDVRSSHGYGTFAIDLGGDDVTTGQHAVYRFSGSHVSEAEPRRRCSAERPRQSGT